MPLQSSHALAGYPCRCLVAQHVLNTSHFDHHKAYPCEVRMLSPPVLTHRIAWGTGDCSQGTAGVEGGPAAHNAGCADRMHLVCIRRRQVWRSHLVEHSPGGGGRAGLPASCHVGAGPTGGSPALPQEVSSAAPLPPFVQNRHQQHIASLACLHCCLVHCITCVSRTWLCFSRVPP